MVYKSDNYKSKILNLMSPHELLMDRDIVSRALDIYGNADRVFEVIRLMNGLNSPQSSYTIYPYIINIGDRTPEQYVLDIRQSIEELNRKRLAEWEKICPNIRNFIKLDYK